MLNTRPDHDDKNSVMSLPLITRNSKQFCNNYCYKSRQKILTLPLLDDLKNALERVLRKLFPNRLVDLLLKVA